MPTEETPPASPMMNLGDRGEGDDVEEDAILDEDAIEVIEIPDDVADHEPEEEGGTDVGIVEDEEEMVTEENPPEDNSVADFSAHNCEATRILCHKLSFPFLPQARPHLSSSPCHASCDKGRTSLPFPFLFCCPNGTFL